MLEFCLPFVGQKHEFKRPILKNSFEFCQKKCVRHVVPKHKGNLSAVEVFFIEIGILYCFHFFKERQYNLSEFGSIYLVCAWTQHTSSNLQCVHSYVLAVARSTPIFPPRNHDLTSIVCLICLRFDCSEPAETLPTHLQCNQNKPGVWVDLT